MGSYECKMGLAVGRHAAPNKPANELTTAPVTNWVDELDQQSLSYGKRQDTAPIAVWPTTIARTAS